MGLTPDILNDPDKMKAILAEEIKGVEKSKEIIKERQSKALLQAVAIEKIKESCPEEWKVLMDYLTSLHSAQDDGPESMIVFESSRRFRVNTELVASMVGARAILTSVISFLTVDTKNLVDAAAKKN
jgi:hypothetical protein